MIISSQHQCYSVPVEQTGIFVILTTNPRINHPSTVALRSGTYVELPGSGKAQRELLSAIRLVIHDTHADWSATPPATLFPDIHRIQRDIRPPDTSLEIKTRLNSRTTLCSVLHTQQRQAYQTNQHQLSCH